MFDVTGGFRLLRERDDNVGNSFWFNPIIAVMRSIQKDFSACIKEMQQIWETWRVPCAQLKQRTIWNEDQKPGWIQDTCAAVRQDARR